MINEEERLNAEETTLKKDLDQAQEDYDWAVETGTMDDRLDAWTRLNQAQTDYDEFIGERYATSRG